MACPSVLRSLTVTVCFVPCQHSPAASPCSPRQFVPGRAVGSVVGSVMVVRVWPEPRTWTAFAPKSTASTNSPGNSRSVSPERARVAAALIVPVPGSTQIV